ncbi:MAG: hypothetical protein A2341_10585 [Deltaproteobacteria bacterium RIFOXYB12_FULL_58_9]|nr:MAG: hypothetical protein A2341_10585 [Deltaproteobacteria bacterium RIFOXYB12_FULL_58_9]
MNFVRDLFERGVRVDGSSALRTDGSLAGTTVVAVATGDVVDASGVVVDASGVVVDASGVVVDAVAVPCAGTTAPADTVDVTAVVRGERSGPVTCNTNNKARAVTAEEVRPPTTKCHGRIFKRDLSTIGVGGDQDICSAPKAKLDGGAAAKGAIPSGAVEGGGAW